MFFIFIIHNFYKKNLNFTAKIYLNQESNSYTNSKKKQINPDIEKDIFFSGQEPEDDDEDKFNNKSLNNKNFITIDSKNKFSKKDILTLKNLNNVSIEIIYNFLIDRDIVLKEYRNKSGIYLIHNNVNGKQYIGSAHNLGNRLASYYFPSRLLDKRYISNSILKYGHINFSVIILHVLGTTGHFCLFYFY